MVASVICFPCDQVSKSLWSFSYLHRSVEDGCLLVLSIKKLAKFIDMGEGGLFCRHFSTIQARELPHHLPGSLQRLGLVSLAKGPMALLWGAWKECRAACWCGSRAWAWDVWEEWKVFSPSGLTPICYDATCLWCAGFSSLILGWGPFRLVY